MQQENNFIDTLKIVDGHFIHPLLHFQRMVDTLASLNEQSQHLPFPEDHLIPAAYRHGIVKCRYLYTPQECQITFEPYTPRRINSLKLVAGDHIDYHLKYANRKPLNLLLQARENCDDILIVQNNCITDTSYSNIVFFDGTHHITPTTYLLNGLKRQYLLQKGIIQEKTITISDLKYFHHACLINAMLDIEDHLTISIQNII